MAEDFAAEFNLPTGEKILWFRANTVDLFWDKYLLSFSIPFGILCIIIGISFGIILNDWWQGVKNAIIALILFIFLAPVIISDVSDLIRKKQHLHLTRKQLSNYLTAEVVTNQRWIQKNYEHNFPDNYRASFEEQYPDHVHKEADIAWVYLKNILAITETKNPGEKVSLSLHCSDTKLKNFRERKTRAILFILRSNLVSDLVPTEIWKQ